MKISILVLKSKRTNMIIITNMSKYLAHLLPNLSPIGIPIGSHPEGIHKEGAKRISFLWPVRRRPDEDIFTDIFPCQNSKITYTINKVLESTLFE
jgi:hypothetical protein